MAKIKSRAQWQAEHQVAVALARQELKRLANFNYAALPGPRWLYVGQVIYSFQAALIHFQNITAQSYERYRRTHEGRDIAVRLHPKLTSPDLIDKALQRAMNQPQTLNIMGRIS